MYFLANQAKPCNDSSELWGEDLCWKGMLAVLVVFWFSGFVISWPHFRLMRSLVKLEKNIKANPQLSTTLPTEPPHKVPHLLIFFNISRDGDSTSPFRSQVVASAISTHISSLCLWGVLPLTNVRTRENGIKLHLGKFRSDVTIYFFFHRRGFKIWEKAA